MDNSKMKDTKYKIYNEPDFINSKKHKHSLKKFLNQHPNVTTDNIIAYFICSTPLEVQQIQEGIVKKLRQSMKVDL